MHAQHGVSPSRQRLDVLRLALLHTVPPSEYYRFELFRPERRREMWSYVFTAEVSAFHRWRSEQRSDADVDGASRLLSDKCELVDVLGLAGVPMPDTLCLVPAGANWEVLSTHGRSVVFCKPRVGSGATGVFRSRWDNGELSVWTLDGTEVVDSRRFVEERFGYAEYLVQPYIETNAALAHLGRAAHEAITLRVITEMDETDVVAYCAYLEIPLDIRGRRGYLPAQVNVRNGVVERPNAPTVRAGNSEQDVAAIRALEIEVEGLVVPQWDALMAAADTAHRRVAGAFAVAWDFIVGPDGPVLLEGNSSWATALPQQLRGPLLAEERLE